MPLHYQDTLFIALFFILSLTVFLASPVTQLEDSNYSMLLSESLLVNHVWSLNRYSIPQSKPFAQFGQRPRGAPSQIRTLHGSLYYNYPWGSSVLSIPFVALMNIWGVYPANPDGSICQAGEIRIQRVLAALLMSVLCCISFRCARLFLPFRWSAVLTTGLGFGTQIWSTATRALWSHTWQILLLGCVVYSLTLALSTLVPVRPILLATLLAWMYFVRPTSIIDIVTVTMFVALYFRPQLRTYSVVLAIWFGAYCVLSWTVLRYLVTGYESMQIQYFEPIRVNAFAERFCAILFSPSRGLFIFVSTFGFTLYLTLRFWELLKLQPLVWLALASISGHVIVLSLFTYWWGGWSYGPRLLTDTVPWFFVISIFGCIPLRELGLQRGTRRSYYTLIAIGLVMLLLSMAINSRGALSWSTLYWNAQASQLDAWDWRHAQFLAGL